MNKSLSRENLINCQHFQIQYVPSFYFTSCVPKETIETYISVIMTKIGMQVYGYNRQNDEYFGEKMQGGTGSKIKLTISLSNSTTINQTNIVITTINATHSESEKITKKMVHMIKLFEETKSIYRTKYYRAF